MARGKKKETLTPEERLQAALVPESEQPYKVPRNWCWVRVSSVCEFERGITFPASAKEKEPTNTNIPCLRTANVQDELEIDDLIYVDKAYMKGNEAKLVQKDDIIMSSANSRELVGKTSYVHDVPFPMTFGGFVLTIRAKTIISKYLFYFLRLEFLSGHFMGESTQTTNIANINTTKLGGYALSCPPLAEQQRIVDRIESLFARLDEAKQKAQDALDSFEPRKAAILHKAFTGELTAQWRKEHGVGMESWKEETLESVCYSIFDGDHMPPPKSEQGIPFLVISNVNTGHLSFENTRFVPESYYEALSDTRKPEYGDVLYTLVGSYGIPVIVDREHPFCFQRHMALLKPKNIDSYYLWYILQSREMFEKATQIATGTAQLTVPIKGLRQLKFNCASANEQGEIVRILDDLLAKEQQAKDAAEGVLEQIDLIKKAILTRAFRGELGTNDPSEESAVELVKRVLAVEPPPKARAKAVSIPREVEEQLKCELERKIMKLYYYSDSQSLPINTLMEVSSKKFEVLESIRNLEQRGIIKKLPNGNYKLVR